MSLIKAIRHQLGLSITPANNFVLTAQADDGTMKLARGNADATTQDIMTVDAAGVVAFPQGVQGVPAGAVMDFAMNAVPAGWLACDGAAVSRTTYAALFAALGTTWGAGDGSTTFNLPDMRAYFRRGAGTNSDGTVSGAFAEKQLDSFKDHAHRVQITNAAGAATTTVATGNAENSGSFATSASNVAISPNANGVETRPKNIAVLTCIKT